MAFWLCQRGGAKKSVLCVGPGLGEGEQLVAGRPASLYAPEDLMPRSAEIALETGVIIYGSLFRALAEGSETVIITADDRLSRP